MIVKDVLQTLKAKQYSPVYLLHGKESYFIDQITQFVEDNVLQEHEKSFNQLTFYGKETDAKTIIDASSRYPMMAERQVILLKEAQAMRTFNDLIHYLKKPVPTTLLVICYKHKRLDSRTALGKLAKASEDIILFESKPKYDNEIPSWIESYLQKLNLQIDPKASSLIAEYLGTDLGKVSNELDKLALNLPKGSNVQTDHVQEYIGISKDYNVFELTDALAARNSAKVFRIVSYFAQNPTKHPMVLTLGALINYFSKLYLAFPKKQLGDMELAKALGAKPRNEYAAAFQVKKYRVAFKHYGFPQILQIIALLKEFDLKAKGVDNPSTPGGELLRELAVRILNV